MFSEDMFKGVSYVFIGIIVVFVLIGYAIGKIF